MSLLLALGSAAPGAISGTAAITFGGSGTLTGIGVLAGSAAIAFGQPGTLTGLGALAGTAQITLGGSGTPDQPAVSAADVYQITVSRRRRSR